MLGKFRRSMGMLVFPVIDRAGSAGINALLVGPSC